MCSITGFLSYRKKGYSWWAAEQIAGLLKESESRGRDGFGYVAGSLDKESPTKHTSVFPGGERTFRSRVWYREQIDRLNVHTNFFLANHRAEPTTEFVGNKKETDQQPYQCGATWGVHNGTIPNDKEILEYLKCLNITTPTTIDSYALIAWAAVNGEENVLQLKQGSIAALFWNDNKKELTAARNYQPLIILWVPDEKIWIFSSLESARDRFPNCVVKKFPPYSVATGFTEDGTCKIVTKERQNKNKALVVCSGGLDSVTAATIAKANCEYIRLLHFRYGCIAEAQEMMAVAKVARVLDCEAELIDMAWLKKLGGSPLTEDGKIAGGEAGAEFAHEWVPARNTAMLGIAAAYADRYDYGNIYAGLNLEESGAYCDNTVEFFTRFNEVLDCGTLSRARIINPLANLMKKEIVELAYKIGAPIHLAWSCYVGGDKHCGQCGPCHMRQIAHKMLGIADTVEYER